MVRYINNAGKSTQLGYAFCIMRSEHFINWKADGCSAMCNVVYEAGGQHGTGLLGFSKLFEEFKNQALDW